MLNETKSILETILIKLRANVKQTALIKKHYTTGQWPKLVEEVAGIGVSCDPFFAI